MWSFVFKTSQRLALWVLFQVWLTQLTFPTLERKLATVFITPLILVSTQQLWNHPYFAWKWAKCFFTCRNPPCIVPRTFTSGHISSGFSNCTNFGLDRVNRQTNQKNPTIIWGTWSLGAPTSGVLHALSGHPGRVTHTTQINLQSSSVGWTR